MAKSRSVSAAARAAAARRPTSPFPGGPKPGGKGGKGRKGKRKPTPDDYEVFPGPFPEVLHGPEMTPEATRARLEQFKREMLERRDAARARGAAKTAGIMRGRKIKGYAKAGGIAALAGLGAGLAYNRYARATGTSDEQLMNKALFDLMGQHRQMQLNGLVEDAKSESYDDAISRNLQRIQQNAPDLYMAVAAGRKLPTGAVVLGGTQRTDLLQDLGRSMSDGQYT